MVPALESRTTHVSSAGTPAESSRGAAGRAGVAREQRCVRNRRPLASRLRKTEGFLDATGVVLMRSRGRTDPHLAPPGLNSLAGGALRRTVWYGIGRSG